MDNRPVPPGGAMETGDAEARAQVDSDWRAVLRRHADALSVSSTKSMHAHCMGASGAVEMIACIMAIREGIVPPTANYREPDPDCDLDVTPNVARTRRVRAAISNSFAFGGTNAVVALCAA